MERFIPSTPAQQQRSALVALSTMGAVSTAQHMTDRDRYEIKEVMVTLALTAVTAIFTETVMDVYRDWKENRVARKVKSREVLHRFQWRPF